MDNQAEKNEVAEYLAKFEELRAERSQFENHWQECYDHIIPRKAIITTTKSPGNKRGYELFDTTAITANQQLGGMLHGFLTNPAVRFADFTVDDPKLMRNERVMAWLDDCADIVYNILNQSNFQTEIHEIYLDQGAIGTACLYMEEDDRFVVRFSARNMAEIFIDEAPNGSVDTVYRRFEWTPARIVKEFGEETPAKIKEMAEKGVSDKLELVHIVKPMDSDDMRSGTFKYESVYICVSEKLLLSSGGYKEFPFAVPRWTKTAGEKYGRSPGMDALPDIKMVNAMMETTLAGAQRTVNPPLMVQDDAVIGSVRLVPGGLTLVRPSNDKPIQPLIVDARIDFGYQVIEDTRKRVRAAFFVDKLWLSEGPQMTATEVMQRSEEGMRFMGPVVGRQHFDGLRPMMEWVMSVLLRKKLLPAPPEELRGRRVDVRYSSLVARAQRAGEGRTITQAIQTIAPLLQISPESVDVIKHPKF